MVEPRYPFDPENPGLFTGYFLDYPESSTNEQLLTEILAELGKIYSGIVMARSLKDIPVPRGVVLPDGLSFSHAANVEEFSQEAFFKYFCKGLNKYRALTALGNSIEGAIVQGIKWDVKAMQYKISLASTRCFKFLDQVVKELAACHPPELYIKSNNNKMNHAVIILSTDGDGNCSDVDVLKDALNNAGDWVGIIQILSIGGTWTPIVEEFKELVRKLPNLGVQCFEFSCMKNLLGSEYEERPSFHNAQSLSDDDDDKPDKQNKIVDIKENADEPDDLDDDSFDRLLGLVTTSDLKPVKIDRMVVILELVRDVRHGRVESSKFSTDWIVNKTSTSRSTYYEDIAQIKKLATDNEIDMSQFISMR
jgi:hypothetical protein